MGRPRSRRRPAVVVSVALAVLLALALAVVHVVGPSYGVWLVPPSPRAHGEHALSLMDQGLHAHGDEWDRKRAEALDAVATARSRDEVNEIIDDALAVAGGPHSFLLTDEEQQQTQEDYQAPTHRVDGGVMTVKLPAFSGTAEQGQQYADELATALAASGACGVVVDLSDNSGGDMGPMLAGLSPLIPDGPVVSFDTSLAQSQVVLDGGSVSGGGTPTTAEAGSSKLGVPVAIITSGRTASSGEQARLAFNGIADTRVFGQPTRGYASVNQGFRLYGGLTMYLTIGETLDREGTRFGETPIEPDERVDLDQAQAAAASWLDSKGCR